MKIMRHISEIVLGICVFLPVAAPAEPITLEEVIAEHCLARKDASTVKAKFRQIKIFTLFDEDETSSGMFFFAQPDRICWQYKEPDKSSTVINGTAGWSVFPDIKQVQKFELEGSNTNKVLSIVGFGNCGTPLTESFDIEMKNGKKRTIVLRMTPTDDAIIPYFSRIDLTLDGSDFLPRRIELYEKGGDILRFEFTELKKDIELDDSIFEFNAPEGYEVVSY